MTTYFGEQGDRNTGRLAGGMQKLASTGYVELNQICKGENKISEVV